MQEYYRGELLHAAQAAGRLDTPAVKDANKNTITKFDHYLALTRGRETPNEDSLVPWERTDTGLLSRKRPRTKSYEFAMCLQQTMIDTMGKSLLHFRARHEDAKTIRDICPQELTEQEITELEAFASAEDEREGIVAEDPFTWPAYMLNSDAAPDCFGSMNFTEYELDINGSRAYDHSHGWWADVKRCLNDTNDYQHHMLMNVLLSMAYRPWDESLLFQQGRQVLEEYFTVTRWQDCTLLEDLYEEIAIDLGWHHRLLDPNLKQDIWERMQTERTLFSKNYRPSSARWFESFDASAKLMPTWGMAKFKFTNLAVQSGRMDRVAYESIRRAMESATGEDGTFTADDHVRADTVREVRRGQPRDPLGDALRAGLMVAVGVLNDPDRKRREKEWLVAIENCRRWMGKGLAELKSVAATSSWLERLFFQGEGVEVVGELFELLRDRTKLEEAGFLFEPPVNCDDVTHPVVGLEFEHAEHFTDILFSLGYRRCKRNFAFWFGYPGRTHALGT